MRLQFKAIYRLPRVINTCDKVIMSLTTYLCQLFTLIMVKQGKSLFASSQSVCFRVGPLSCSGAGAVGKSGVALSASFDTGKSVISP